MNIRITTYFGSILAIGSLFLLFGDMRWGILYAFTSVSILIPIWLNNASEGEFDIVFFAAFAIWATHLLRPLVLLPNLDLFLHFRIGYPKNGEINIAFLKLALYSFLLLMGMVSARKLFKIPTVYSKQYLAFGRTFWAGRNVIPVVLLIAVIVRLFLLFATGIGIKSTGLAKTDFLTIIITQLLPDSIIYFVCIVYLMKYRGILTRLQVGIVVLTLVVITIFHLFAGSKAFLAKIVFVLILYTFGTKGNFRVNFSKAIGLTIAGFAILVISFSMGASSRSVARDDGIGIDNIASSWSDVVYVFENNLFDLYIDKITSRMAGFDGLLVSQMHIPEPVREVFSISSVAKRVADRVIPFSSDRSMFSGKAVSVFYFGFEEDHEHAAGLGIIATLDIMFGGFAPLGCFLFGLGVGYLFLFTDKVKDVDISLMGKYFVGNFLFFTAMSGNIDRLAGEMVINTVLVVFAYYLINYSISDGNG